MIQLYKGEALEVMQMLIEAAIKVDAIITDPPYGDYLEVNSKINTCTNI